MPDPSRREESLSILNQLHQQGYESYWAGGCVRDLLLGRTPKDYDIATKATPQQVATLFPHTVATGAQFGVMQVIGKDFQHEVSTFRKDLEYLDGRHPEGVVYTHAEQDAQRRDFTINGLFYDPVKEQVMDYVQGQQDLKLGVIRAIGQPEERFGEDFLRMLRAPRFAATLGFHIEEQTAAAIRALAGKITQVSWERIGQEVERILVESPRAGEGIRLYHDLGLLAEILPEVVALIGQEQPAQFHPEGDVFTHTMMMLDAMENPDATLAFSVLLHDIAKPPTAQETVEKDGTLRIRFNGHAALGAEMAHRILSRLKRPNRLIETVMQCVAQHMRFVDVPQMKRSTLRRMVGAETFPTELELHRLDCLCSHGHLDIYGKLQAFIKELAEEPALPQPWVTGKDLMDRGLSEGPIIGQWLLETYNRQLEGVDSTREESLKWLESALKSNPPGD